MIVNPQLISGYDVNIRIALHSYKPIDGQVFTISSAQRMATQLIRKEISYNFNTQSYPVGNNRKSWVCWTDATKEHYRKDFSDLRTNKKLSYSGKLKEMAISGKTEVTTRDKSNGLVYRISQGDAKTATIFMIHSGFSMGKGEFASSVKSPTGWKQPKGSTIKIGKQDINKIKTYGQLPSGTSGFGATQKGYDGGQPYVKEPIRPRPFMQISDKTIDSIGYYVARANTDRVMKEQFVDRPI
jgi:hypothetical protein